MLLVPSGMECLTRVSRHVSNPLPCMFCLHLCGRMPDAVTLAPGSCLPLVSLYLDARCCDAGSAVTPAACFPGRVSRLSPCVSQSLRSNAKCCDAGSGVVSPAFGSLRLPSAHVTWQQLASAIEKHQARHIDSTSQQEPLATMFRNRERACRRFCC